MAIGTTIKTIQDIMRKDAGVDGDAQRISQLVWMIFLKVFDDHESQKELLEDNSARRSRRACGGDRGRRTPRGSPARLSSIS